MFVINADNNSGVNAAGYPTMNGYLDTPLDGQYYTMFPTVGNGYQGGCPVCVYACSYLWSNNNTSATITQWSSWNGNQSNACSFFQEYKANDIDHTVIYPFHYTGLCQFYGPAGYGYKFAACGNICGNMYVRVSANTCPVNTIYNYTASTCFDNLMFYRFIAKKKFSGGEIVGKNIRGHLRACINNNFTSCCQNTSGCCWKVINTCPLNLIVNFGLIHTDGSKDCIINCRIPFPYGCLYNASSGGAFCYLDNICSSHSTIRTSYRLIDILPGSIDTDGLEAEEGDRIFIEYCTEGCIKPQMIYTNCANYSSPYFARTPFYIWSMNDSNFKQNCIYGYPLYDYCYESDHRYEGISFSID